MKILSIRPRRGHLAAVYCDNREEPWLLDKDVVEERLHQGMTVTEALLTELSDDSARRRAMSRALYLLGFRDHSKRELRQKLLRLFPAEAVTAAIDRCGELGLLDDLRFAHALASDCIHLKGFGTARVRQELAKKGIDRDTVQTVLEELQPDPADQLDEILARRFSPLPEDDKGKRRMMNYLLSRGYHYHDIKDALQRAGIQEEEQDYEY
ncbi:MAG: regulatory protein RecX [Clostridia bacterium]|nr:regulatory protein RecX [Clostridia bacterium]